MVSETGRGSQICLCPPASGAGASSVQNLRDDFAPDGVMACREESRFS